MPSIPAPLARLSALPRRVGRDESGVGAGDQAARPRTGMGNAGGATSGRLVSGPHARAPRGAWGRYPARYGRRDSAGGARSVPDTAGRMPPRPPRCSVRGDARAAAGDAGGSAGQGGARAVPAEMARRYPHPAPGEPATYPHDRAGRIPARAAWRAGADDRQQDRGEGGGCRGESAARGAAGDALAGARAAGWSRCASPRSMASGMIASLPSSLLREPTDFLMHPLIAPLPLDTHVPIIEQSRSTHGPIIVGSIGMEMRAYE